MQVDKSVEEFTDEKDKGPPEVSSTIEQVEPTNSLPDSEIKLSKPFKHFVGFLTGFTLLFIYSYLILKMLFGSHANIESVDISTWKSIVTTIGGLISAVMVAIFTATPTNESMFKDGRKIFSSLICSFAAIWFFIGILTIFYGTINFNGHEEFKELTSYVGMTWLATAVAGTYAFLKLEPPST